MSLEFDREVPPVKPGTPEVPAAARIPRVAVSTCLVGPEGVLLVERGREPFLGLLSLPGGRVEFGETLEAAACRELEEETGIRVGEAQFAMVHEAVDDFYHAVILVHRALLPPGAVPVAADDARSVRFVPVEALAELEATGATTPGLAAIVQSIGRAP